MHDCARNAILNEDVFNSLAQNDRSIFIYEWLCYLNETLLADQKNDIDECQSQIIKQLLQLIPNVTHPPIRILIGRNLAMILNMSGQSSLLIKTMNRCIDILRMNDEVAQLTTVVIIGAVYERLSRFLDRSYEETVRLLLQLLKTSDSQMRHEVLLTLEHIINGLGPVGHHIHHDIYKLAKTHLCHRTMPVRSAAALCLIALIHHNNFMYTSELERNIILGLRAFEGSNDEVRCSVANYLAILLAAFQSIPSDRNQNLANQSTVSVTNSHKIKVDGMFNYLSEGFIRSHLNGLKFTTTDQVKMLTTVQNEVRMGITHTYVALIRLLGINWIEQNLSHLIDHLLRLAGNSRMSTTYIDTIFIRQCITFILRSVIDLCPNEKVQFMAAKELTIILTRYTTSPPIVNSSTNDSNRSPLYSSTNSMIQSYGSVIINPFESSHFECYENILICALDELSLLIQTFEISTVFLLQDDCNDLIDTLFSVILNPSQSVRLTAAWCFRSIAIAVPSFMTLLIDQCLEKMLDLAKELNSSNTDAISGLALVLQALLGAVHQCPLGIPSKRVKRIFDFADNLLRTTIASTIGQEQSVIPRLILQRTSTAWHLLSACCTIDQSLGKRFLPRLVLLWRNVFPRSSVDFEQEKQRGDSLTWMLSFNQRAGALCSMISFYSMNKDSFLSIDLLQRMINSIENAIIILFHIPNLIRQFDQQLKISTTIFRLRLYELLLLIPNQYYEKYFQSLWRELLTEFTLLDSSSNTTTSLLKSICDDTDYDLLGNCLRENNHQLIDEQLHPHSSTDFGALEHDHTYLYRRDPLPVHTAVIDASIQLYTRIFTYTSNKQRVRMFQSLVDAIKKCKDAQQETMQMNILIVVFLSLKTFAETKEVSPLDDDLKKCACAIIIEPLNHSNPILRCIAAKAFGRLIQVLSDERLITTSIQFCFDHLRESHDIPTRTGYTLALACAYRYLDNRGQYLNQFIPVFHTLMEDQSRSVVQIWALHALTLITDSGEQMCRNYIEPLVDRILQLLLCASSSSQLDIYRSCGRLLNNLIVNVSSDLQTSIDSILTAINLLHMHMEPVIQAQAVRALQQLYLSSPHHVNLSMLVTKLIQGLTSPDLSLRRTCISCLIQLSKREANEVHKHANLVLIDDSTCRNLQELLFSLLDTEKDTNICSSIQDMLVRMLQTLETHHLTHWLQLCNDILANTAEKSNMKVSLSSDTHRQRTTFPKRSSDSNTDSEDDNDAGTDINNQLNKITERNLTYRPKSPIKWQTKVFALHCVQKLLINYCTSTTQSNLHSSTEHLPAFISSSFLACTSTYDPLRLSGLSLLKQIILTFAYFEKNIDPSALVILKQYQIQIAAALRSAFSRRTSPHVTAHACDVCWIWISSHLAHDIHDLRRIHQLLLLSLQKFTSLQQQCNNQTNMICHETTLMMENLAILKLWADVYSFVVVQEKDKPIHNLLLLIQTELHILIHYWLGVLTDYAFLMLPREFQDGNFYSTESMKTIYKATWSSIMQAVTQWLVEHHYELETSPANRKSISYGQRDVLMAKLLTSTLINKTRRFPERKEEIFAILLACCTDALSTSVSEQTEEILERILVSLMHLLRSDIAASQINIEICIELMNALYRLSSVRTDIKTQSKVLEAVELLFHRSSAHLQPIVHEDQLILEESFLFTSLKLIVSILLNYFPTITDDVQLYSTLPVRTNQNDTQNSQIIDFLTSTIQLLYELIRLHLTSQNIQKYISVVLHLLLSISFVLLSSKSDLQQPLLSAILQILENCFCMSVDRTIFHGAMITIMNLRAKLLEKNLSDHGYFVRCLTSLIIKSKSISTSQPIIDFYRKVFEDRDMETRFHLIQSLDNLFQSNNLSLRNKFIRIFTPLLLIELKQIHDQQQIIEVLKIIERLLSLLDSSARLRLASLIIPLFMHFLPDATSSSMKMNVHLTRYITERLQYLSSIYSNEFSLILQRSPDIQLKLANAIDQAHLDEELNHHQSASSVPFRMAFSNFTSLN